MSWNLANPNGILAAGSTQDTFGVLPPQFNAGAINGIVHYDAQDASSPMAAITLVSTPTSGVWKQSDPEEGTWKPLSLTWNRPDLTCLVRGDRDIFDVFAAGGGIDGQGTLWENGDWSGEFGSWNNIDLGLLPTGTVNGATTIHPSGLSIIVLACEKGVWWSLLPAGLGGVYSFKKAVTPSGAADRWSSVAAGNGKYPDSPLWAARWGDGSYQTALFAGSFDRDPNDPAANMLLKAMVQPDVPVDRAVFRVLLSAAPTDDQKRLLVGEGGDGSIAFVWKMTGISPPTWVETGTTVGGVANGLTNPSVTGLQRDLPGAIAFSKKSTLVP